MLSALIQQKSSLHIGCECFRKDNKVFLCENSHNQRAEIYYLDAAREWFTTSTNKTDDATPSQSQKEPDLWQDRTEQNKHWQSGLTSRDNKRIRSCWQEIWIPLSWIRKIGKCKTPSWFERSAPPAVPVDGAWSQETTQNIEHHWPRDVPSWAETQMLQLLSTKSTTNGSNLCLLEVDRVWAI